MSVLADFLSESYLGEEFSRSDTYRFNFDGTIISSGHRVRTHA